MSEPMISSLKYGGASGSHWDGCSTQHWDCLIVSMRRELAEVRRDLARAQERCKATKVAVRDMGAVLDHFLPVLSYRLIDATALVGAMEKLQAAALEAK